MNCHLLISVYLAGYLVASALPASVGDVEWTLFKQEYGKQYESHEEELRRREIFAENKRIVDEFNVEQAEKIGFSLGMSHLSDWTEEETTSLNGVRTLQNKMNITPNEPEAQRFLDKILSSSNRVPEEVDWRKVADRVGPVKDQGLCSSSWVFAAIGALEGQEIIRNKSISKLITLSEQNIIDCVTIFFPPPCSGGQIVDAFITVNKKGGVQDEKSYPYEDLEGSCRFNRSQAVFANNGYVVLPTGDEEALKKVVANFGPVAVHIDATKTFKRYKTGIFSDLTCASDEYSLNQSVLIVGYGIDATKGNYWIVKNSWGADWGENGYIKMSRNQNNQCGIATAPVIPFFF